MAEAGDRFEMPDGSVYVLRRTTAETGGEYVELEFVLPSGCVAPPPHIHPQQFEEFEALEGNFDVFVDGSWRTLRPGESASLQPGVLHTFRNRTGETIRVRNVHRPALRFEEFIERVSVSLREAGIKTKRDPRVFLCLAAVMADYEETLTSARRRERIPLEALAALGRLLRLGGRA